MLGTVTRDSGKGGRHAEAKWDMNAIYISERLQESLRPIARCPLTTVVAPMGYGKTTAVNWYLEERARTETPRIIRISVYSDNLAIFWKSVQDAFARAGLALLRDYDCPTDAAGGSLLADDLCHELAGEKPCYLFIDDFHLLTDGGAAGGEGLPDRHGAAAAEPHGAVRIRPALRQRFSRELRWFTDAMDTFSQG